MEEIAPEIIIEAMAKVAEKQETIEVIEKSIYLSSIFIAAIALLIFAIKYKKK